MISLSYLSTYIHICIMCPDEGGVGGGRDPHGVAQSFVEAAAQSKQQNSPRPHGCSFFSWLEGSCWARQCCKTQWKTMLFVVLQMVWRVMLGTVMQKTAVKITFFSVYWWFEGTCWARKWFKAMGNNAFSCFLWYHALKCYKAERKIML